jgi:nitrate reductase alpha subunit
VPRGAAFSWYTYSPTRIRYPYVRGVLLDLFRAAKERNDGDAVLAWGEIVGTPELAKQYKSARGKGGFVRATWDEAVELASAAHVHTVKTWGPDRVAGFSPIPAMSMVSHAAGARFYSLLGAPLLSFYDWYADLPMASPQVFGDQTDVPESGDWWDASYLILWGSNVPVTRTPDAHWMTEARYRGQKVVVCSPRLLRRDEVRRRVARARARHRRRARDGDGPRRAPGVLRRPHDGARSPTTSSASPTCRSS